MKIVLKRNGIGSIKEFNNKEELQEFAKREIERKGIIDNEIESKILDDKTVTIDEIISVIDYKRI